MGAASDLRVLGLNANTPAVALAGALLFLLGCSQEPVGRLSAGQVPVCRAEVVQTPSTFPLIVPGPRLHPTADGFVVLNRRWRFTGEVLRAFMQPQEVEATAWRGDHTLAASRDRLVLWDADGGAECTASTRPISSVGVNAHTVLWTDWVDADPSSAVYEVDRSAQGCGLPRLVATTSGSYQQLSQPHRLGSEVWALRTSSLLEVELVSTSLDGGIKSRRRLKGWARLCGSEEALLAATDDELIRVELDGGVSVVWQFASAPVASDCDGVRFAVASAAAGASTISEFPLAGSPASSTQVAGAISAVGLSRGGWLVSDGLVRRWDGGLIQTADTALLQDVWAYGGRFLASTGAGPVLRPHDGDWQIGPALEEEEELHEVSDGLGGTVKLFGRGEAFELWEGGEWVLSLPRSSFFSGSRSLDLRLWKADSCSGDLLLGIEFDGKHALAFRRHGEWRLMPLPLTSYLYATIEDGQLSVAVDWHSVLRRPLDGSGEWERAMSRIPVPADARRVLPDEAGLVIEQEQGVGLFTGEEVRPLSPAGARLLGISDGWVFWASPESVSATALP